MLFLNCVEGNVLVGICSFSPDPQTLKKYLNSEISYCQLSFFLFFFKCFYYFLNEFQSVLTIPYLCYICQLKLRWVRFKSEYLLWLQQREESMLQIRTVWPKENLRGESITLVEVGVFRVMCCTCKDNNTNWSFRKKRDTCRFLVVLCRK